METLLLCIQGSNRELRFSYPERGVVQMNYSTVSDLQFTSYNNLGVEVTSFIQESIIALKINTVEAVIQMDALRNSFTIQCIVNVGQQSVLVSQQQAHIVVSCLDQLLASNNINLETIPEENDDQKSSRKYFSPIRKLRNRNLSNKENFNQSDKKPSPKKHTPKKPSPKKASPSKKTTISSPKKINLYSPSSKRRQKQRYSPQKNDPVDQLLAQLIQQNKRQSQGKRRRSVHLRAKVESEGMIDRAWLEEEMINEDL